MILEEIKEMSQRIKEKDSDSDNLIVASKSLIENILDRLQFFRFTRELLVANLKPSQNFKIKEEESEALDAVKNCTESDMIFYTLNYIGLSNPIVKEPIENLLKDLIA